jgi:hypothetical protein
MNRNTVIVDGTRRGPSCNAVKADQNFGPRTPHGPDGMNGVEVFKADHVSVENLTACNFLAGAGNTGNGVWWNGGANSGRIGGRGFRGAYLTATSTYYDRSHPTVAAAYGIYSSNWSGGTWGHAYASNFSDSGFYIGACQQRCDQTIDHARAQFNAVGFSGSNSGGRLLIANSEFDHNADGVDTNSQNGDNPPPQDGACPHHGISPITHTRSCWVFRRNYVHDNNNANVPAAGASAGVPVGTGISLSGARNDTVIDNRIVGNGAWGTVLVPFPDTGPPCTGGTVLGGLCLYDESGIALLNNTYTHNGFFGNPSNGDFAFTNAVPGPADCFAGNRDTRGPLTSTPANAEHTYKACNGQTVPPSLLNPQSATFAAEIRCDSNLSLPPAGPAPCAPTDHYPRQTTVTMHALPRHLPTMPNPCSGVPANPWCPAHAPIPRRHHNSRHHRDDSK